MRNVILVMALALTLMTGQLRAETHKSPPPDVGPGRIAWFDITTSSLPQSKEFYGKLFDWRFTPLQGTDQAVEIVAGGAPIGTLRGAEGKISGFNGVVGAVALGPRSSRPSGRHVLQNTPRAGSAPSQPSDEKFHSDRSSLSKGTDTVPKRNMNEDDPLDDFNPREITLDGVTKVVHVAGSGPAVIVMTEMPGISPHVARFSRWVRDAGFTVYMPSLFGRDGAIPSAEEGKAVFQRACVSAEFRAFAANESSPVTQWLRSLARLAHEECGGPGVGAIGMCFTGNFALSMMLEPAMLAPVLSQPTLPLNDPAGMHIAPDELVTVRQRLEREDLTVMAYRFEGDRFCTAQRFAAYSAALGDRFIGRVLPDSAANPDTPPFFKHVVGGPHSVVTAHLIDEAGQPTIAARDEILSFFTQRLGS